MLAGNHAYVESPTHKYNCFIPQKTRREIVDLGSHHGKPSLKGTKSAKDWTRGPSWQQPRVFPSFFRGCSRLPEPSGFPKSQESTGCFDCQFGGFSSTSGYSVAHHFLGKHIHPQCSSAKLIWHSFEYTTSANMNPNVNNDAEHDMEPDLAP